MDLGTVVVIAWAVIGLSCHFYILRKQSLQIAYFNPAMLLFSAMAGCFMLFTVWEERG